MIAVGTEATTATYCTERNRTELTDLVSRIQICAKDAAESSHDALRSAITAGGYLVKAKRRVLHGKWGPWLKQNFEFSAVTANNWMRLYGNRNELVSLIKDTPEQYMSVHEALQLVGANPKRYTPTKLQKVEKRCADVIKEIYSDEKADARRLKEILIEHVKEVHGYIRTLGRSR